jgi:ribosome biogenesis protein MAK21
MPPKLNAPHAQTKFNASHVAKVNVLHVSHWYSSLPQLHGTSSPIIPSQLSTLTSRAASLLTDASAQSKSSEQSFFHTIIQSGTLSDRLSALTLLVQESPIHNTKALDSLKSMVERGKGKGGRDESLKALRCIVDWWVGGGAPERKLKSVFCAGKLSRVSSHFHKVFPRPTTYTFGGDG